MSRSTSKRNRRPYPFSYDLNEMGQYFLAFRNLTNHWKEVLSTDNLHEVSYEKLVENPDLESRKIFTFLGLPWEDEVLDFHEYSTPSSTASATQVRQPIYSSSIGKWRHYKDQLMPLQKIIEDGLQTKVTVETK